MEKLLPSECALIYGQVKPAPRHVLEGQILSDRHNAASNLHGWDLDAHHALVTRNPDGSVDRDERLRLTREQYMRALEAPADCDQRGVPRPYPPALSPHSPLYQAPKAETAAGEPAEDGDK